MQNVAASPVGLAPEHSARGGHATAPESPRRSRQEVLEATRALGALLGAGVPLARALSVAATMIPEGMAAVLEDVRVRISSGAALASALAAHPRAFSPLYRGVVRAGERSGNLRGAFTALTTQLESDARIRARLVSAAIYPILLAGAGLVTIGVLVRFVLPRFADLLAGVHASLPWSTATLLAFSTWVQRTWPWLLAALVAGAAGLGFAMHTNGGRRAWAELLVRLPLVGTLRRSLLAARFARVLGVLLGSGAPLLTALDDARDSMIDPLARDEVARVRVGVREGSSLHAALAEGALFPTMLARLVAVGEESGRLREFLDRTAEICEDRVERMSLRMVTILEPAMIIAFGVLIAFVALSLLQAIYGVNAATFR